LDEIPLNDLSRGDPVLRTGVVAALERVAQSGRYLGGREREGFEREFAAYVGAQVCVGVASGTDAIRLALLGVGCRAGDEVLTAANAGMYTTTAALNAGLVPRYADVDPRTLNLSRATVAEALSGRTRAVVVTHLYGQLADIEGIADLCHENSVAVIEDCAQAVGASRSGRSAGTFGDAGAFSFYPTKNLGAMGDAGAVVTGSREVESRVRSLSQYGWEEKYRVSLPGGGNSRIDEMQAAVLRVKLGHVDSWNGRRRDIAMRYAEALPQAAGRFPAHDGDDYVAHMAVMLTSHRAEVQSVLSGNCIATEVHYPIPDHRQPVWRGRFDGVSLPVTETTVAQVLTVPCFPELGDEEVDRVCQVLHDL
jgi:dTDP-4-amino-4,6-dideoxygalactose transaminase